MPIRYICKKCGRVLWSFTKVGQDYFGVPTPDEIKRMYGVCPTCKREFETPSIEDVVIKSLVESIYADQTLLHELSELADSARVGGESVSQEA